jgi:hypothetical protein
MRDEIEALKGKTVEVMANGLLYEGILIGASEESISLQTSSNWLELPMEQITWLRGKAS